MNNFLSNERGLFRSKINNVVVGKRSVLKFMFLKIEGRQFSQKAETVYKRNSRGFKYG